MFFRKKSYIDGLLSSKDARKFVDGITANPAAFFKEAGKDTKKTVRDVAGLLSYANSEFGQSAILLGLVGALKVAAKDKRAPKEAAQVAEKIAADLLRAFKMAGK